MMKQALGGINMIGQNIGKTAFLSSLANAAWNLGFRSEAIDTINEALSYAERSKEGAWIYEVYRSASFISPIETNFISS